MKAAGQILRLVGILIEIACLIPILRMGGSKQQFAGIPLTQLLVAGIILGAILWAGGLFMIIAAPKHVPPKDRGSLGSDLE
jgi:hypothetical protein